MIVEALYQLFEPGTFSLATILFIIGFIIWELPRSVKVMDEEYTSGFYPEMGRVFDIIILLIGLVCVLYLYFMDGLDNVVDFLRYGTFTVLFAIIILAIPVLIFLGYLKRFLARVDKHESMTIFLVHSFLDLAHTVFFICFSLIFIPVLFYLLFGGL